MDDTASVRELSSTHNDSSMAVAAREILATLSNASQWGLLAWNDVRLRYRRTTLGPLWNTMGLAASLMSVGVVYGVLFGNNLSTYLPYFATGLIAWSLVGTILVDGCGAYTGAAGIIKAVPVSPVLHVCRQMTRQYIIAAHNFIILVVLWLVFPWPITWASLLIIPGLVLDGIVLFGAVLSLSMVAARFRDVQLILSTCLQLIFLITPVIWQRHNLKGHALIYVADFNPFYHLVDVIRRPMLGEAPALMSWIFCLVLAVITMSIGVYNYARYRRRIAFWV